MLIEVNSNAVLERYCMLWRLLGFMTKNPTTYKRAYSLILTIAVTICFPLHLLIGLVQMRDPKDIFWNLMIIVACLICSIKHFFYYPQFKRMEDISRLLQELDGHVIAKEDRDFHRENVRKSTKRLLNLYVITYEFVGLAAVLMWLMIEQPSLLFPAWFPFDWKASTYTYLGAVVYQLIGFQVQIMENIAADTYVALGLCLLSGHTRLLANRISRIGYDKNKSEQEHYTDLVECAKDYKRVMRFFYQLQETISWIYVLQSIMNALHFCVCVIFMVFYAEDVSEYGLSIGFLVSISVEFYPNCYYGSSVEKHFHDLTNAMFSCDWQNRHPAFQRSLRIFAEFTLRPGTMYGKSMVKIHLDTYFNTMRLSYSLFCLILNMK